MIPCLIWPLSVSWHHHNGLGTQNTNLHIMTSAYLWKIDCISVNIDQFSSKFRYVVAKTILYQLQSPKWKHHGVFLRLKEACQFFTFCVKISMGQGHISKLAFIICVLSPIGRWISLHVMKLYEYCFSETYLSSISLILALFCLKFELTSPPILVPNKYYMSSFSYFDPLFCVQDNLKMAQSNILKFNTHMYRHIEQNTANFSTLTLTDDVI